MKKYILYFFLISSLVLPDLISPQNGSNLRSVHIFFEWSQEPDAVAYNFQILFNGSVILDRIEESTVYIEKDLVSWDSDYSWRVRPIYESGELGDWIGTSNFSILGTTLPNLEIDIYDEEFNEDG